MIKKKGGEKMAHKKTHEEYEQQVALVHPNIEVVGKYINAKTSIEHKCKIDGYKWYATPNNVLQGHGCPMCTGNVQKTHKQYVEELKVKNPNVIVLEQYVNAKTPILHKCLVDNFDWLISPTNALKGQGCPLCRGRKISEKLKKSCEQYVYECSIINPNIEVIDQYIDSKTPIRHRCKIDGYVWYATPNNILSGTGCPKCANNIKRTHDDYLLLVAKKNPNIKVMEEYVDAITPIKHYCTKHQISWSTTPYSILNGCGCPDCCKEKIGNKNRKTHEQYILDLYSIRDDIEVYDTYINENTPILHYCKRHNQEWMICPSNALMGHGCPMCKSEKISLALTKSHEWYVEKLKLERPHIEAIDEYVNNETPIRHFCKIHNYTWKDTPHDVFCNIGCPKCTGYKHEQIIAKWLDDNMINYISQYRFNDCRDKNALPFDFYLPMYNMCIEYDGRQHYYPVDFAGKGEEWALQQLKITQTHDKIKTEYCKNNNILLLRISYLQNIEEELCKNFYLS